MRLFGTPGRIPYIVELAAALVMVFSQFYFGAVFLLATWFTVEEIARCAKAGAIMQSVTDVACWILVAFCCWQMLLGKGRLLHRIAIYIGLAACAGGLWYMFLLQDTATVSGGAQRAAKVVFVTSGLVLFFLFGLPLTAGLLARYWLRRL